MHAESVSRQQANLRDRATLIDQKPPGRGVVGWWRMLRPYPLRIAMYTRIVTDASLPLRQKLVCEEEVLRAVTGWGVVRMRQLMSGESSWSPEPS